MPVVIGYEEDLEFTLGALGANDAIAQATKIDATRLNGFRVSKVRISAVVRAKTASEGPISWGLLANYSAAELEAAIEADPQSSTDDNVRGDGQWLTHLGLIGQEIVAAPLTGGGLVAQPIEVMPNWSVIEGKNFSIWAHNQDGSALTAGTIINAFCEFFGVWLRD